MAGRPWLNVYALLMVALFCHATQSFPLVSRHKRHTDSLFTSELSKVRGRTAARNLLNTILGTQTSSSASATPGKVKRHLSEREDGGSPATLQNMQDLLSAFQSREGGKALDFLLRRHEVPTMLKEVLTLHHRAQPCRRWFYIYYLAKSLSPDKSYLPATAVMDHRSCGIIRQLVEDLQLQAFQTLQ